MDQSSMNRSSLVYENIIHNMNDGVLIIDFHGVITLVNPAAERLLDISAEEMLQRNYSEIFFEYEENDTFNQCILDAVYEKEISHNRIVDYYTGNKNKSLFLTTSFLQNGPDAGGDPIGVIAVFNDVTEITELRDAVQAMNEIRKLNQQLESRNQFISQTFGRYLSDEVVKDLIEKPGGLSMGGETHEVSIIMTDLRGFTSMSESLAPEIVVNILNHYLGEMVDIIMKYRGTILEFIGDAIMVVFGTPVAMDDHANHAVACALEMQLAMDEVNCWNRQQSYPTIEMGIGINSGLVVAGNIGSEKRAKYSLIGRHVNLAARVESYTVGGKVFISHNTLDLASASISIKGKMEVYPKGIRQMVKIYDVDGIGEPYNLYLPVEVLEMVVLARPIPVRISLIHDKQCGQDSLTGLIGRLSLKQAEVNCEVELEPQTDVKIEIGEVNKPAKAGDIYAKVMASPDGSDIMSLRITSISSESMAYLLGILDSQPLL
ncbi:MAG: hypothetical protein CVU90_09440 [Firmicutes bacterium HGW-Firmicutes-15]|nr:MAG: hypothetical protein CVU90_09440 [Firmicutes bacterium HGW-Firmicutes-15]